MIFTVTETPWTTGELADLHGISAGLAKKQQTILDHWIVDVISAEYVLAGTRADQAANSIRCRVERLHNMFKRSPERMMQHVARLIKIANDKAVMREMENAGRRFPANVQNAKVQNSKRRAI